MNYQKDGYDFENRINSILLLTKKQVLREKDIKQYYGIDITAVDHLIFTDNYIYCFQDKWRNSKPPSPDIIHFIKNVNDISKIENKKCIGVYISKMDLSKPSQTAIDRENSNNNNYFVSICDNLQNNIFYKLEKFLYNNKLWLYDTNDDCIMLNSEDSLTYSI